VRDAKENELIRVGGSHEEKTNSVKNEPLTFVDVIKNDFKWKIKLYSEAPPPLVELDFIDDMEEEIEVEMFIEGKNIPMKNYAIKTKGKA
jgi:hypothetical protein